MLRGIFLLIRNPGLLRLVPKLMYERRVPLGAKLLLVSAIVYLISPFDLVPDFLPIRGRIDDVLIILISLASLLGMTPKEVLSERYGDGKRSPDGQVIEGTYRVKDDGEGDPDEPAS